MSLKVGDKVKFVDTKRNLKIKGEVIFKTEGFDSYEVRFKKPFRLTKIHPKGDRWWFRSNGDIQNSESAYGKVIPIKKDKGMFKEGMKVQFKHLGQNVKGVVFKMACDGSGDYTVNFESHVRITEKGGVSKSWSFDQKGRICGFTHFGVVLFPLKQSKENTPILSTIVYTYTFNSKHNVVNKKPIAYFTAVPVKKNVMAIGISVCNEADTWDINKAKELAEARGKDFTSLYKLKNKVIITKERFTSTLKNEAYYFTIRCQRYYKDKGILLPKTEFI